MIYFAAIVATMAAIATASYFYERRHGTSRGSRGNAPCIEPDGLYGDGRTEEFHGGDCADFDGGGDGDGD